MARSSETKSHLPEAAEPGPESNLAEARKKLADDFETDADAHEETSSEAAENEPIDAEELAEDVTDGLIENPELPEDVREQLEEHREEIKQTVEHNVHKVRDFLYGAVGGVATKVAATWLLRNLGARALDLTVPGLGIAVSTAAGGIVGGAYEGVRAFRKEGQLVNSAERAQERLEELSKLEPIEKIKRYAAIQAALQENKYTGNTENLQNALDAIDVEQMVRNVEWEKQPEALKRLQTLVNIRDGAQKEILLKDEANKQILEQLQKDHAKGKRSKAKIAKQALKGALIGGIGGAVGGSIAYGVEHWLGWGASAASGAVEETSKKTAAAVTKEATSTKADLIAKMHKHVWGTVKEWYIEHGVPKDKITNKLLVEGVRKITEHNPGLDLPNVPHEELKNLVQVKGWETVKGLAYNYMDHRMKEGVPLHHMERLLDVAKDHGISITDSALQHTTEHGTTAATTAVTETGSTVASTAAQTAAETAAHAAGETAKQAPQAHGLDKLMYIAAGAGVVTLGGLTTAKILARRRKNKAESAKEQPVTDEETMDDDDLPSSTENRDGGGTPEAGTPEPKTAKKKRRGILELLNSPMNELTGKGKEKARYEKALLDLLIELEKPLKDIFGPNFVIKYSKKSPAEEYLKEPHISRLKELATYLEARGFVLVERGINRVSIKLDGPSTVEADKNGDKALRVNLSENLDLDQTILEYEGTTPSHEINRDYYIQEAKKLGITDQENIERWVNLMNNSGTGPLWMAYGERAKDIQSKLREQMNWKNPYAWEPVVEVFTELIKNYNEEKTSTKLLLLNELSQLAPQAKKAAFKNFARDERRNLEAELKSGSIKGAIDRLYDDAIIDGALSWDVNQILNTKGVDYRKKENQELLEKVYQALFEGLARNPGRSKTIDLILTELKNMDNAGVEQIALNSSSAEAQQAYNKLKSDKRWAYVRRLRGRQ